MSSSIAAWETYEQVTAWIVEQISDRATVRTTRLEPGRLVGRATTNQIDLIWEFIDHYDRRIRLLFECRSYATRIGQGALHAWRSVVDDVAQDGLETLGVMVTTTGYQAGATRLAETYGITIFELRTPSPHDTQNRAMSITVPMNARVPICRDVSFKFVEELTTFSGNIHPADLFVVIEQVATPVLDVLLDAELSAFDEPPRPLRRISKSFDPPAILRFDSNDLATISVASATVGESDVDPIVVTVDPGVLWMLKNTLTGGRLWFGEDGRVVETPT